MRYNNCMDLLNRSDVLRFIETLEPEYQKVFWWAEDESQNNPDTLSSEFQIASTTVDAFWKQAAYFTGKEWARERLSSRNL